MEGESRHSEAPAAPGGGVGAVAPATRPMSGRTGSASGRGLPRAVGLSAAAHATLLVVVLLGASLARRPQPSQRVLTARLVRLGPTRPKEALPQLDAGPRGAQKSPRPTPPKRDSGKAAPGEAPGAAAPNAQLERARSRAEARSALARLKREAAGATDGDVAGDTDLAAEGDRYGAQVKRCLEDNYVIEGVDKTRLAGLKALVVVRIQADGRIVGHRLAQSPGVASFEQAIERAVRRCARVPPPPVALQRELQYEGIGIEFEP